jgi:hypothetical protein
MSQRSVEQTLGRLMTDEAFRRDFFRDPDRATRAAAHEHMPGEMNALTQAPRAMLAKLGARLADCICRLAVPDEPRDREHSQ